MYVVGWDWGGRKSPRGAMLRAPSLLITSKIGDCPDEMKSLLYIGNHHHQHYVQCLSGLVGLKDGCVTHYCLLHPLRRIPSNLPTIISKVSYSLFQDQAYQQGPAYNVFMTCIPLISALSRLPTKISQPTKIHQKRPRQYSMPQKL